MNSAHPPMVLIFEITAIRPAKNLNRNRVFTFLNLFGHIKFGWQPAILTVTDYLVVYPNIKSRTHTSKMQNDLFSVPIFRQFKCAEIGPNRIGACLLYTSDAADEEDSVDLGGRRIIKKK